MMQVNLNPFSKCMRLLFSAFLAIVFFWKDRHLKKKFCGSKLKVCRCVRLDPNPDYWEGKRGACIGVFQLVIAGKEPTDSLREVITMLRSNSNPQV